MQLTKSDRWFWIGVKLALAILVIPIAALLWGSADPVRYDRPDSLFFRPYKAPAPPLRQAYTYFADGDLGIIQLAEREVRLPKPGQLIRADFEGTPLPQGPGVKVDRRSLAIAFVADCTGSMAGTDPNQNRFREPAKMAARLQPDDAVSCWKFSDQPELLSGWTAADRATVPSDEGSDNGASPASVVEPIVQNFDDPEVKDKRRIAVILSDLGAYDGIYVRRVAEALVKKGVCVFTIRFGGGREPVDAQLIKTCKSLGGDVLEAGSADGIASMIDRVASTLQTDRKFRYRIEVEFSTTEHVSPGDEIVAIVDHKAVRLRVRGVRPR